MHRLASDAARNQSWQEFIVVATCLSSETAEILYNDGKIVLALYVFFFVRRFSIVTRVLIVVFLCIYPHTLNQIRICGERQYVKVYRTAGPRTDYVPLAWGGGREGCVVLILFVLYWFIS